MEEELRRQVNSSNFHPVNTNPSIEGTSKLSDNESKIFGRNTNLDLNFKPKAVLTNDFSIPPPIQVRPFSEGSNRPPSLQNVNQGSHIGLVRGNLIGPVVLPSHINYRNIPPPGYRPPINRNHSLHGQPKHINTRIPPPVLLTPRVGQQYPISSYQMYSTAGPISHGYNNRSLISHASGNLSHNQEIWIETLSPEGKTYFYHSKTRETTWNKPKNVQIMTQIELERLAAIQNPAYELKSLPTIISDNKNSTNRDNRNMHSTEIITNSINNNININNNNKNNSNTVSIKDNNYSNNNKLNDKNQLNILKSNSDQFNNYNHKNNANVNTSNNNKDNNINNISSDKDDSGEVEECIGDDDHLQFHYTDNTVASIPFKEENSNNQKHNLSGKVDLKEVTNNISEEHIDKESITKQNKSEISNSKISIEEKDDKLYEDEILKLISEWSEHENEEKRLYYYNSRTMESTWFKPRVLLDYETKQISSETKLNESTSQITSLINETLITTITNANSNNNFIKKIPNTNVIKIKLDNAVKNNKNLDKICNEKIIVDPDVETSIIYKENDEVEKIKQLDFEDDMDQEVNQIEKNIIVSEDKTKTKDKKSIANKSKEESKHTEKEKPIFTKPIHGTPWCIVWMDDGRIFFFNPSLSISTWDRPIELYGRDDIDKMIQSDPIQLINHERLKENSNANESKTKILGIKKYNDDSINDDFSMGAGDYILNKSSELLKSDKDQESPKFKKAKISDQGPLLTPKQFHTNYKNLFNNNNNNTNFNQKNKNKSANNKNINNHNQLEEGVTAEAEAKAALKRSYIPYEERYNQFYEMLLEKKVSAFSTWEKVLPAVVFDPRYLLLAFKERKPAFEDYTKKRIEIERKEKNQKTKEKKEIFKKLLEDARIHTKSKFSEFCMRHGRDERFKAIDKMKEREAIFNEYITNIRTKQKQDSIYALEQIKEDFMQMLHDTPAISNMVYWPEARLYLQYHPLFRLILEHPHRCEQWFQEHCDSLFNASTNQLTDSSIYTQPIADIDLDNNSIIAKERKDRAEASLREREKEVQQSLAISLQERDKERKSHMKGESIQHFKALLTDMIKSSDCKWRESRHALHKDPRWALAKGIDKEEKQKLFEDHVGQLLEKNRLLFHKLLDENLKGSLTVTWKQVRRSIRDDPRYTKISSHEKIREKEFDECLVQKRCQAKLEFKELLKETRIINHKSAMLATDSAQYLKEIITALQKDKRYLVLDTMSDERGEILMNYIEEVARQGPPPPPTATDPRSRILPNH